MYANLTGALVTHGRIKTTLAKAKEVRPVAEKMVTLGKRGDLHARRQAIAFLRSKTVVHTLFADVAPGSRSARAGTPASSSSDRGRVTRRRWRFSSSSNNRTR
jgi:large subunit ribosomal protein L17